MSHLFTAAQSLC